MLIIVSGANVQLERLNVLNFENYNQLSSNRNCCGLCFYHYIYVYRNIYKQIPLNSMLNFFHVICIIFSACNPFGKCTCFKITIEADELKNIPIINKIYVTLHCIRNLFTTQKSFKISKQFFGYQKLNLEIFHYKLKIFYPDIRLSSKQIQSGTRSDFVYASFARDRVLTKSVPPQSEPPIQFTILPRPIDLWNLNVISS